MQMRSLGLEVKPYIVLVFFGALLVPGPASLGWIMEVTDVPYSFSLASLFTYSASWPAAVEKVPVSAHCLPITRGVKMNRTNPLFH